MDLGPLDLILAVTVGGVGYLIVDIWLTNRQKERQMQNVPNLGFLRTVKVVGQTFLYSHQALFKIADDLRHHYTKFTRVLRGAFGYRQVVVLGDARDVELILGSSEHIDKAVEYQNFHPWLGDGLLITTGDKWKTHRKLIAPTFHFNVLKSFFPHFNKNSRDTVEKMDAHNGQEFDVHELMGSATVDILMETVMGVEKQREAKKSSNYALSVIRMCEILHFRTYKFWLWPTFLFNLSKYKNLQEKLLNIIHSFTDRVIEEKKKGFTRSKIVPMTKTMPDEHKEKISMKIKEEVKKETETGPFVRDDLDDDVGEKKRVAFLDLMLEAQSESGLTDTEIRDEVNTIMFEGHDTTAAGASFFLSILGIHKDVQEKVFQEVYEIFGDSNRYCTQNDIAEMKYLERVLLESLRLYPPVPMIAREIQRDVKLASLDATLPKGTTIVISQYVIHRLPEHWGDDAEQFNPDHFLPEKMAERHPYAFIAFSAGPRSCVGRKYALMKLKVLLSTIVRNFKIHSDLAEKDFGLTGDIILKRSEGFPIRLERRRQQLTV